MTNKGFVFSHFDNTYTCRASTSSYMLTWKQHRKLSVDALDFSRNFHCFPLPWVALCGSYHSLWEPCTVLASVCWLTQELLPFLQEVSGSRALPSEGQEGQSLPRLAAARHRLVSGRCADAGADIPSKAALWAKLKMIIGDFYFFEQLT